MCAFLANPSAVLRRSPPHPSIPIFFPRKVPSPTAELPIAYGLETIDVPMCKFGPVNVRPRRGTSGSGRAPVSAPRRADSSDGSDCAREEISACCRTAVQAARPLLSPAVLTNRDPAACHLPGPLRSKMRTRPERGRYKGPAPPDVSRSSAESPLDLNQDSAPQLFPTGLH